ncbi:hypothetical protein LTR53_013189, partial [Teratosphaeriaceae sp. CCFEE 6253]
MQPSTLLVWLSTALSTSAVAIPALEERQSACSTYTIINTRGTGEPQGESSGFRTMNANIRAAISGGTTYNTVYAAGADQNSAAGTTDIINHINTVLAHRPNECFILEGYSQGAEATVNAMSRITGNAFTA